MRLELDEDGRLLAGGVYQRCKVHDLERDRKDRLVAVTVDLYLRYETRRLRIAVGDTFDALDAGGTVTVTGFRVDATGAFVRRSTSGRGQAIRVDRLAGTRYRPHRRRHEVYR